MMPASKDALLFVPEKSAGEKSFEGPNSLDDPTAKDRFKVRSIMPLSSFDEFLARLASRPQPVLYLRLSPSDTVSDARYESALFQPAAPATPTMLSSASTSSAPIASAAFIPPPASKT